jgi:hypothetical protein
MKVIIFVSVFLVALVGFCVYLEISTRNFVDGLPKASIRKQKTQDDTVPSALEVGKPTPADPLKQETDTTEQETAIVENEIPAAFDWTDNDTPDSKVESSDPFGDYLEAERKKERGTWRVDGMSPEAQFEAEYNQMLEQLGDIPAVHTVMKYQRMSNNNVPITFDEDIEWQEALVEIYPTETNKRTLAFDLWRYSRGRYPADLGEITHADIAELRAMGIKVTEELTSDGYTVTIFTE